MIIGGRIKIRSSTIELSRCRGFARVAMILRAPNDADLKIRSVEFTALSVSSPVPFAMSVYDFDDRLAGFPARQLTGGWLGRGVATKDAGQLFYDITSVLTIRRGRQAAVAIELNGKDDEKVKLLRHRIGAQERGIGVPCPFGTTVARRSPPAVGAEIVGPWIRMDDTLLHANIVTVDGVSYGMDGMATYGSDVAVEGPDRLDFFMGYTGVQPIEGCPEIVLPSRFLEEKLRRAGVKASAPTTREGRDSVENVNRLVKSVAKVGVDASAAAAAFKKFGEVVGNWDMPRFSIEKEQPAKDPGLVTVISKRKIRIEE